MTKYCTNAQLFLLYTVRIRGSKAISAKMFRGNLMRDSAEDLNVALEP